MEQVLFPIFLKKIVLSVYGSSLYLQERARAELLGYKDPINPDYEATSAMYHSVLDECLTRIRALKDAGDDPQKIGIMVASHNADTVRYGVKRWVDIICNPSMLNS